MHPPLEASCVCFVLASVLAWGDRSTAIEDKSLSTRSRHCVGLGIGRFSVRFHTGVQRECKAKVT
jgi:hypothetical protein